MDTPSPSPPASTKILLALLVLNVVASLVHYSDNIARWSLYPEPAWDNARLTDGFWFLMTPAGVAGYWLYRRGNEVAGLALSAAYAAMNLVVLGHYLFASPGDVSPSVNATILFESATGAALLGYLAWVGAGMRPLSFEE
jgi:hypothetical protein